MRYGANTLVELANPPKVCGRKFRARVRPDCIKYYEDGVAKYLPIDDIYYLKTSLRYVLIYHKGGAAITQESLKTLEKKFPNRFIRVHRESLVALPYASYMKGAGRNTTVVIEQADVELRVGEKYVACVRSALQDKDVA